MEMKKPNMVNLSNFEDPGQEYTSFEIRKIPKNLIEPAKTGQVRTIFNERKIADLRENIREVGQIEPITVEAKKDGSGFVIIAGERRWRAINGIDEIQDVMCIIREFNDERERFTIQLSENFDREDLTVSDRAIAIDKLVKMYDGDVERAAKSIGKSRSTLIKMSSVLQLPPKGREFVEDGFSSDYSSISMLKTLFSADARRAESLIDRYRQKQEDRPLREALRAELDSLSQKKTKPTKSKQQTITANEIYMQENNEKIYISSRNGLITIKLEKISENIRNELYHLLSSDNLNFDMQDDE